MQQMLNPYLQDRIDRVIRDPRHKLAWNDRLIGTSRMAIEHEIQPTCFATGAALAVELLLQGEPDESLSSLLDDLWRDDNASASDRSSIFKRIERARFRQLPSLSL